MQRALTPTLAIIVAGGLAAGIALARPADSDPVAATQAAVDAGADNPAEIDPDNPYRRGTRSAGSRDGAQPAAPAPADGPTESPAPAPAGSEAPAAATITIEGFAFDGPATVAPGAELTVTNLDGAPHTLTFRSGEVDTGDLAGGATTTVTAPLAPGTYDFFCRIHPSMEGRIEIAG